MSNRKMGPAPHNPIGGLIGSFCGALLFLGVLASVGVLIVSKSERNKVFSAFNVAQKNTPSSRVSDAIEKSKQDQINFERVKRQIEAGQFYAAAQTQNQITNAVPAKNSFRAELQLAWQGQASSQSLDFRIAEQLSQCMILPLLDEESTYELRHAKRFDKEQYALQKVAVCENRFKVLAEHASPDVVQSIHRVLKNRQSSLPLKTTQQ